MLKYSQTKDKLYLSLGVRGGGENDKEANCSEKKKRTICMTFFVSELFFKKLYLV